MISTSVRSFGALCAIAGGVLAWTDMAAAADDPAPELSISLRGIWDGAIEAGEPFRVAVRVDAPAGATTSLELAPSSGSWIDATTVEILAATGREVLATARPAPTKAERVTRIDADNPISRLWWFRGDSLRAISPGEYRVQARLVIRDGSGWKGEVVAEPAPFRVIATSNEPERVAQRTVARAHAAIFAGEPAKAAEILDSALETDPDNVPVLVLRAALSLQGGNRLAASACMDRALMLSRRPGEKPSIELHELAMRIEQAMAEDAAIPAVPGWTRVPESVFEPLRTGGTETPVLPLTSNETTPGPTASAAGVAAAPVISPAGLASEAKPAVPLAGATSPGAIVPATELADAAILADTAVQWAASAIAGSQYGRTQYSAAKATGAPDIAVAGNSPDAWCPANKNDGSDWLEVAFATPVFATEVRIRQNDTAGAIAKVEAIGPDGITHVWWEGVDPFTARGTREIVWFAVRVPKTDYLVAKVKITLNLAAVPGWKEIDAVQLVGTRE